MTTEDDEHKKKWEVPGLFVPAGLFLGFGIGWALGYLPQGIFVGLGIGFLGMAIARLKMG